MPTSRAVSDADNPMWPRTGGVLVWGGTVPMARSPRLRAWDWSACQTRVMTECEPQLVPELAVLNLTDSLNFWRDLVGFDVSYARIEEGFAYLVFGQAHLMLDQIGMGRTWRTGELDVPLGRGINLQVRVPSLGEPLQRLAAAQWSLFLEPEEKWYRTGKEETGVIQFLVQDPDGYLLRLQSSIGTRPVPV
jgi:catechol 2,3-dioxygenase-like lactoylglutathione lyase family enzyme